MKYDVVLEGGGVKIPALAGALSALESRGFEPAGMAGTSAGSIVAAMRIVGYTPSELINLLYDLDFKQFKDGAPRGTKIYHLLKNKGIYAGDVFLETIRELIEAKGLKYFGDLDKIDSNGNPLRTPQYPLRVFTADVSNGRLVQLPDNVINYGYDPNRVEIAWAIRCSMSIPYFFRPMKLTMPGNGEVYFVDGGLLSNFPIYTWDSKVAPRWPTFGVMLWEDDAGKKQNVKGPINFLGAMFNTVLNAHDRRFVHQGDYVHRTIKAPVGSVSTTDFDIDRTTKKMLVDSGKNATDKFLDNWSWDSYLAWAKSVRGIS